jgi:hypothetical protein
MREAKKSLLPSALSQYAYPARHGTTLHPFRYCKKCQFILGRVIGNKKIPPKRVRATHSKLQAGDVLGLSEALHLAEARL